METILEGQLSAWTSTGDEQQLGVRYIPEMRMIYPLNEKKSIDADIALNASAYVYANRLDSFSVERNTDCKFYRASMRYASSHYELRAGLQKINFGPAKILRSLMWFDHIDFRDPLQFTDGVNALLGRYYCLNNANVWLWGIQNTDDKKGIDLYASDTRHLEIGGRYQFPVPRGEVGFSVNQRYVDPASFTAVTHIPITEGIERRYAFDGNWDFLGMGLWCEAALHHTALTRPATPLPTTNASNAFWETLCTLGGDYTWSIGTGLHVLGEHAIRSSGTDIDIQSARTNVSAVSFDYTFTILDRIMTIGYYDWDAKKVYSFLRWTRTYDSWQFHGMVFSSQNTNTQNAPASFQGVGCMIMAAYNY